jgi:hypothetical protein
MMRKKAKKKAKKRPKKAPRKPKKAPKRRTKLGKAKKKAVKKKVAKKKASAWKKSITVKLVEGQKPQPLKARLSRSKHGKVRFRNTTTLDRVIAFGTWPFTEPGGVITARAGRTTRWYHIVTTGNNKGYGYTVTPPTKPGPPGGPEVFGGD